MRYEELARRVLQDHGYLEKGWAVESESVLTCPHGHRVEYDGTCPDGCRSPLLQMKMI